MKKTIVICLACFVSAHTSAFIIFDDGLPHTIDYHTDFVEVLGDGTSVSLEEGGAVEDDLGVFDYGAFTLNGGWTGRVNVDENASFLMNAGTIKGHNSVGNASFTMNGGTIEEGTLVGNNASFIMNGGIVNGFYVIGDGVLTMNGGIVNGYVDLEWSGFFNMYGGEIGTSLILNDDCAAYIYGGTISQEIRVAHNSNVYLYGTGFYINGTPLENGDKLTDYATLDGNRYTGTITGILDDGSELNNVFYIGNDTSDIIVIPEPTTLLLLGFGGLLIRRER
jgi:hypothetical protein